MTLLSDETHKAINRYKHQQRLAEIEAAQREWIERQAQVRAKEVANARSLGQRLRHSAWDAERLHRYRSMGYSVKRHSELSRHSPDMVELGIATGGKKR